MGGPQGLGLGPGTASFALPKTERNDGNDEGHRYHLLASCHVSGAAQLSS